MTIFGNHLQFLFFNSNIMLIAFSTIKGAIALISFVATGILIMRTIVNYACFYKKKTILSIQRDKVNTMLSKTCSKPHMAKSSID